jgi:threonine synthase
MSSQTFLTHLECSVCGDRHSPHVLQSVCRTCGKALLARYNLSAAKSSFPKSALHDREPTMWRYAPLLPVERPEHIVSLGETMTPLLPLRTLAADIGVKHLIMKDEGRLPTGSFKARGLCMAISKAQELGVKNVCIPSAGNAAGALAAYAARAGMQSFIFLPDDTPDVNIKECLVSGAHVELVNGNISDAAKAMNQAKRPDWFEMSTLKEPYRLEGKKTMGFEVAEQFGWNMPDVIVYPTGGGTGLIGMWKAFDEMEELGWIGSKRPRMISVQSSRCAPIVKAFEEHQKESEFWQNAETIASGLRVPKAFADYLILRAIEESNGHAVAVSDEEIVRAVYEIAHKEGLFVCPEGAATLVAVRNLVQRKVLSVDENILVFNTGTGIKYPEIISREVRP